MSDENDLDELSTAELAQRILDSAEADEMQFPVPCASCGNTTTLDLEAVFEHVLESNYDLTVAEFERRLEE